MQMTVNSKYSNSKYSHAIRRPRPVLATAGAALVTAVILAGCTRTVTEIEPARWQNPAVTENQSIADRSSCLALADREAALLMRDPVRSSTIGGSTSRIEQSLDQIEARERKARLFENCMRQRGYSPIDE